VQVLCGDYSGSAVYLGSGRYVTAAHVVTDEKTGKPMNADRRPARLDRADGSKIDYALIRAAHYPPFRAMISCDRLRAARSISPPAMRTAIRGSSRRGSSRTGEHEHDGIGAARPM
jgi:hypothetical protein